ncbi:MAG: DUF5777 family beta-barrel protein [Rhodothermales bacterium]
MQTTDTVRAPRVSRLAALYLSLFLALGITAPAVGQSADLEARVSELFNRSCTAAGCHSAPIAQMNMNLQPDNFYASTVGEASMERPELKRIVPGDPASSYLIMKLKGDPGIIGLQMPMTGDKLTPAEIGLVEDWIRSLGGVDEARKAAAPRAEPLAFPGWRIVNLPTDRALAKGNILFQISHRFNPRINDGYDALYGLDGSGIIYLHLGYSVTDQFLLGLARSNVGDNVELYGRYKVKAQEAGGWPVGVNVVATGNWASQKEPELDRFRKEVMKFTGQVSLTRAIGDQFGLAVVPGITTNPVETVADEPVLVTVGLGGRWRFKGRMAVVAEWVPIVSGYTRSLTFGNDIRFDSAGAGFEIATAGHVFQIVLSNTVGLTADQYLRGGDLDLTKGDVRLGFNIFRVLN